MLLPPKLPSPKGGPAWERGLGAGGLRGRGDGRTFLDKRRHGLQPRGSCSCRVPDTAHSTCLVLRGQAAPPGADSPAPGAASPGCRWPIGGGRSPWGREIDRIPGDPARARVPVPRAETPRPSPQRPRPCRLATREPSTRPRLGRREIRHLQKQGHKDGSQAAPAARQALGGHFMAHYLLCAPQQPCQVGILLPLNR